MKLISIQRLRAITSSLLLVTTLLCAHAFGLNAEQIQEGMVNVKEQTPSQGELGSKLT